MCDEWISDHWKWSSFGKERKKLLDRNDTLLLILEVK